MNHCKGELRLLVISACLFVASCSYNSQPKELMQGFTSYSTFDEVLSSSESPVIWKITEYDKVEDNRPEYYFLTAETNANLDGNWKGRTVITFFNDRLMSVWFYPDDPKGYSSAMEKSGFSKIGINGVSCQSVHSSFVCRDISLSREHSRWIWRYS